MSPIPVEQFRSALIIVLFGSAEALDSYATVSPCDCSSSACKGWQWAFRPEIQPEVIADWLIDMAVIVRSNWSQGRCSVRPEAPEWWMRDGMLRLVGHGGQTS